MSEGTRPAGPSLIAALRLRCPYCRVTPLRTPGSWFTFRDGCPTCGYRFEREEGYFTGAAWIITYTAASLPGLALGGVLLWKMPELDSFLVGAIAAAHVLLFAVLLMPFGKAFWLYADHRLNPLGHEDQSVD